MSLSFYTSGSSQFNDWLRKTYEKDSSIFIDPAWINEDGAFYPVHELMTELKGIQPKLVKTFRGTASGLFYQFSKDGVYRDPGFISTSSSWHQARLFRRDMMLTVVGVGYPINGQSSFALEQEVLFLPNTKFRLASCANGMLLVQEGIEIPSNWDIDSKLSFAVDTKVNPMAMTITPDDLTFGVEIEFRDEDKNGDEISPDDVAQALNSIVDILIHDDDPQSYWTATDDGSCGLEVKSRILRGREGLEELGSVIKELARMGYQVDDRCGLHVHIGVEGMHPDKIKSIIKRYDDSAIDPIMRPDRRGDGNHYCKSIKSVFGRVDNQRTINGIARQQGGRYCKLNTLAFCSHKTVEIRHHHGTLDSHRVQNWVQFLLRFVAETDTWNSTTEVSSLLAQFDWDEDDTCYLSEEERIRIVHLEEDEYEFHVSYGEILNALQRKVYRYYVGEYPPQMERGALYLGNGFITQLESAEYDDDFDNDHRIWLRFWAVGSNCAAAASTPIAIDFCDPSGSFGEIIECIESAATKFKEIVAFRPTANAWLRDVEAYLASRRNAKFAIWHYVPIDGTVYVTLRERIINENGNQIVHSHPIPSASIHVHFNEDWEQRLDEFLNQYK